jgi:hypothetical protein
MIKLKSLLKEEASKLDTAKEIYNNGIDLYAKIEELQKEIDTAKEQYENLRKGLLDAEYSTLITKLKKLYPNAKGVKKVGDGVLVQLPKGEFIEKPYDVATKLSSEIGTPSSVKVAGKYDMDKPGSYSATVFNGFFAEFSAPYTKYVTNLPKWNSDSKKLK